MNGADPFRKNDTSYLTLYVRIWLIQFSKYIFVVSVKNGKSRDSNEFYLSANIFTPVP
uniref:Uncharacterized protein n=1 Tax=Brugia timori TaxID=42155 RepID=A0A0R3QKH8_9BILA